MGNLYFLYYLILSPLGTKVYFTDSTPGPWILDPNLNTPLQLGCYRGNMTYLACCCGAMSALGVPCGYLAVGRDTGGVPHDFPSDVLIRSALDGLSKEVGEHLCGRAVLELDDVPLDQVVNPKVRDLDVAGELGGRASFLDELHRRDIVL